MGKITRNLCCCILCKNQLTTNNLNKHYDSKQCNAGNIFINALNARLARFKDNNYKCGYCAFIGKNANSIAQHELYCKENPSRKYRKYRKSPCGMLGKKGTNQYTKAVRDGLEKPKVSAETRQKMKEARLRNPQSSYASLQSQKVFKKILSQLPEIKNVFYHSNGREYFLKDGDEIFFYDLTLLDIKFIIEYQGVAYHPKNLYEHFRVPYKSMGTKEDIWNRDRRKEYLALSNGFTIKYIWSDNVENDIKCIVEELQNILKK
jgi:hypothetical protein